MARRVDDSSRRVGEAWACAWLKQFLKAANADVVLAEDVKTSGQTIAVLSDWALMNGWKELVEDAQHSRETNAHSAGVTILARG